MFVLNKDSRELGVKAYIRVLRKLEWTPPNFDDLTEIEMTHYGEFEMYLNQIAGQINDWVMEDIWISFLENPQDQRNYVILAACGTEEGRHALSKSMIFPFMTNFRIQFRSRFNWFTSEAEERLPLSIVRYFIEDELERCHERFDRRYATNALNIPASVS